MMFVGVVRPGWLRVHGGHRRRLAALSLLALASAGLAAADNKPDIKKLKVEPFEITSTPITSFNRSGSAAIAGGKLEWRGWPCAVFAAQ